MNRYKHLIISFFTIIIVVPCVLAILMYIYDPLHIYYNKKPFVSDNVYLSAKYYIDNYNFDSIIAGTSMTERTDSLEAGNLLGGSFINVSLFGSAFYPRAQFIKYILKSNKIKTVITSFDLDQNDVDYFFDDNNERYFNTVFWLPLYDDNKFNDFKVYLNQKYFKCLLTWSQDKSCVGVKDNTHIVNQWTSFYQTTDLSKWTKKNWLKLMQAMSGRFVDRAYSLDQYSKAIDSKLMKLIIKFPNTKFIFLIPPYSTLSQVLLHKYQFKAYKAQKFFISDFVAKCSKQSNCEVYGFANEEFTDDLNNYYDILHYDAHINSILLNKIAKHQNLLNDKNIDKYLKDSEKKIKNFNLNKQEQEILNLDKKFYL